MGIRFNAIAGRNVYFLAGQGAASALKNVKVERIMQAPRPVIVRLYPSDVSNVLAQWCLVFSSLYFYSMLHCCTNSQEVDQLSSNWRSSMFFLSQRSLEPARTPQIFSRNLSSTLSDLATPFAVQESGNAISFGVKLLRHVIAFSIYQTLHEGKCKMSEEILQLISTQEMYLKDITSLHFRAICSFSWAMAEQGGRREQTMLKNYGLSTEHVESRWEAGDAEVQTILPGAELWKNLNTSKMYRLLMELNQDTMNLSLKTQTEKTSSQEQQQLVPFFPINMNEIMSNFILSSSILSNDKKNMQLQMTSYIVQSFDCKADFGCLIFVAPTGSGKTEIVFQTLLHWAKKCFVVVVAQLRTSAMQIIERCNMEKPFCAVDVLQCTGSQDWITNSQNPLKFLVATPEALATSTVQRLLLNLKAMDLICTVFVDDCHEFACVAKSVADADSQPFRGPALQSSASFIRTLTNATKESEQSCISVIGCTGSLPFEQEKNLTEVFCKEERQQCRVVRLGKTVRTDLVYTAVTSKNKQSLFKDCKQIMLKSQQQKRNDVILFCMSHQTVEEFSSRLSRDPDISETFEQVYGISRTADNKHLTSHSESLLQQVNKNMCAPIKQKGRIVVATPIIQSGVSWNGVETVIILQDSFDATTSLQQFGRAGRQGKGGEVIVISTTQEINAMAFKRSRNNNSPNFLDECSILPFFFTGVCILRNLSRYFDSAEQFDESTGKCGNCSLCSNSSFGAVTVGNWSGKNIYSFHSFC